MDHNLFPAKKQTGWGCIGFIAAEGSDVAYVADYFEHGLCELHEPKAAPVQDD